LTVALLRRCGKHFTRVGRPPPASAMHHFDTDTAMHACGEGRFRGHVHGAWNIGLNPNGGYLLALVASAMRQAAPHPDPLSITAHYLQPGLPDQDAEVTVSVLRSGRRMSHLQAVLHQQGQARLSVVAVMGVLADAGPATLALPAPALPAPEHCVARSGGAQGVALPILDRLDVRLHPDEAQPGAAGKAQVSGWIRLRDGRPPDGLASLLFADAFPPPVFGLLGMVGWVPTVELTVHLRCRPVAGWMQGLFRSADLIDGHLIEDGALWDAEGRLVLQSRQLALVRKG
jgi:acyl-CoA thioesterase